MGLFSITRVPFLIGVLSLLIWACNPLPSSKPDGITYGKVQYSKQFGFAETKQTQFLFLVNNKDTQWIEIEKSKLKIEKVKNLSKSQLI